MIKKGTNRKKMDAAAVSKGVSDGLPSAEIARRNGHSDSSARKMAKRVKSGQKERKA